MPMNVTPLPQPVVPEPLAQQEPAWAYVYAGEWVADCPRGCNNVEFLFTQSRMNGPRDLRRPFYLCSYCGYSCERIIWPRREHEIIEILMKRPVPSNRNWYPQDHPVALKFHIPHGQTPADLVAENEEHGVK
jgi:hypothetical protein